MASTRQPPPFQIYQDYVDTPQPQAASQVNKPRPQLQPSAMPLQPMRNSQQYRPDVVISPPMSAPNQISPLKSQPFSPQEQDYSHLQYVPVPAPEQAGVYTDSPVKKASMHPPQHFHPPRMPPQPMFTTFNSNFETFEQENFHHVTSNMQDNFVDFPEPSFVRRQNLKRTFSEATSGNERRFERSKQDDDDARLPEPEDMPHVEDDGGKPPYSYAQMIGMAILRAQSRRLTLAQIYDWISTHFAFYRNDPKQGWHNSIRHNLSLNKAFTKQERPKGDAGKGCYWVIQPGMEMQFAKDKSRKGNSLNNLTMPQNLGRQTMQALAPPLAEAMAPKQWIVQSTPDQSAPAVLPRPQTAPALPELSSDATLPASDPALNEDDTNGHHNGANITVPSMPPPSSPPTGISSSPPVAANAHQRTISSPAQRNRQSAKRHKRGANTMDDSGYFSSLESSVKRATKSGIILTSEIDIDRPKNKRGRAEEEIARIRSSSHDITPSHRRFKNAPSDAGLSSSPVRPSPIMKLNPATPSVIFKKPMRPPPSVSPNTQLRFHRAAMQDFMDSPARGNGLLNADYDLYSPAFKLATPIVPSTFEEHFQAFYDNSTPGGLLESSPIKMSMKRPSLPRSNTGNGILSESANWANKVNARTPSRITGLKAPTPNIYAGSPLKSSVPLEAIRDENDDLFDFGSFADDVSDGEGLDISQGFAKIGGSVNATQFGNGPSSRPPFGRSFTSCF